MRYGRRLKRLALSLRGTPCARMTLHMGEVPAEVQLCPTPGGHYHHRHLALRIFPVREWAQPGVPEAVEGYNVLEQEGAPKLAGLVA